jgi:hypothetical protein
MVDIFRSLQETLKLMAIPNPISINERDDLIGFNLEELEGDFYTFLNPINLNKLHSENLIDDDIKFKLEQLFVLLQDIESKDWNTESFLTNPKWFVIRNLAKEVPSIK